LRDAKARTREALEKAIAEAIRLITADNAKAWFKHRIGGLQRFLKRSKASNSRNSRDPAGIEHRKRPRTPTAARWLCISLQKRTGVRCTKRASHYFKY
ncbi:MAG: hypothetical protein ABSC47_12915, partial [Terracidiphilus sp.]